MKKILALLLALALVFSLAACGDSSSTAATSTTSDSAASSSDNVIKVGVFEPASGENGGGGKQEVLGVEYANSLYNTISVNGTDYTIELVEVDNQSDTTKAVTAAQSLVSDGVSVILGSYGSGVSIAAGDIFAEAQIPAIGCSCTNPQVTEGNDWYFRVCFLDPFQGTVMANFAADQGATKAAVLTQAGDDYSTGLGTYFKNAFEDLGYETVTAEFQTGETDFSSIMANFNSEGVDVIFSPSSIETAPLIIKQARAAGITCPIMAGDTWENETIITNAGDAATDVYLSTFFDENDTSNSLAADFVTGYKEWLNADSARLTNNGGSDGVAAVSALGYDAYMAAYEALTAAAEAAGGVPTGEQIQAALVALDTTGVTGALTFDENGDANKDMAYIKTIDTANGTFTFLKTQSVA